MSTIRKYAGLPDLDPAPDVYETPELTDDNSTHPTSTTLRSPSPESSYRDQDDDETSGIDRHRLDADEARAHFLPIDGKDTTLSSRISSKRKSYRSSSRRRRKGQEINGVEISDDEEESLGRKLTRLRREVEEVKEEVERKRTQKGDAISQETQVEANSLGTLSQVLQSIDSSSHDDKNGAASRHTKSLASATKPKGIPVDADGPVQRNGDSSTYTVSYAPTYQEDHALSKVSDFDSRLTLIEAALGIDAIPLPTQDQTPAKALIPTLDLLDKQFMTLSTSTDSSLDTVNRRVKQLTLDAEKLEQARRSAKAAQEALSPTTSGGSHSAVVNGNAKDVNIAEDAEQVSKINALYGTLSTIESLAPLLPSILDRLRSLRSLHADAATASQSLAQLESRQDDMKQELQGWREGLERVEQAMEQGDQTMKGNTEMVEEWVKELEERIQKLDR